MQEGGGSKGGFALDYSLDYEANVNKCFVRAAPAFSPDFSLRIPVTHSSSPIRNYLHSNYIMSTVIVIPFSNHIRD